jgi:iron complex outermembrane receptor protein
MMKTASATPAYGNPVLRRAVRDLIRSAPIALLGLHAALGAAAFADDKQVSVNIPSQEASVSLKDFARKAGVQVIYPYELLTGVRANALDGTVSVEEGFTRLLAGTELEFEITPKNVVLIREKSRRTTQTSAGDAYGLRLAQGSEAATAETDLQEVVVEGIKFRYDEAQSAVKIPLALKDTPQTVVVVTKDLMDFAGIHQFSDVYKVDASGGTAHAGDQVPRNYYRGFRQQSRNSIKVDGFRMSGRTNLDLGLFERFEVVKGATSTLYGQNSIGGTLNAVSKMPKSEFGGEFSLEGGTFDHFRGEADLYGPIGGNERASYRLAASYLDEDLPVDFTYSKRFAVAPSVKFEISPDTSLLARVSYQDSEFPYYFGYGLQFLGTNPFDLAQVIPENFQIPKIPRSRAANMPWNKTERTALFALTTLEHRFGNDWKLRANLQYNDLSERHNSGNATYPTLADGLTGVSIYALDEDDQVYAGEVNLYGDVELGGRSHTLFLGMDYAKLDNENMFADDSLTDTGFSILHPDYSLVPVHDEFSDYSFFFGEKAETEQIGVTVQVILRPTERLTAILGGRYSRDVEDARSSCCALDSPYGASERIVDSDVTFQTGATFELTPSTNLYASYGQTFEPQSGTKPDGGRLGPQEGDAIELGAKGDLPGRRFAWSVALFEMERNRIAQRILGTPFSEEAGTQRSRGVEVEIKGDFENGWNLFTSLAYLDAEYTEGQFKGAQPVNAPRFGASMFGSYEFLSGGLKGLGFGAGVVHKEGFANHTIYPYLTTDAGTPLIIPFGLVDDFTEVDARVFYRRDNWFYHLAVTNLFDTTYFVQHTDNFGAPYLINPQRSVIGRVTYRF